MFKYLSILYIEDNADDAYVLKEFVKHIPKPIEVDIKSTLKLGLAALEANKYDLVLIDLSLPDSRGLPSIEKIIALNGDIPVVALTGFMDKNIALNAIKMGAQDYLVKGDYNEHVLEKTFSYAIERHKVMKDILIKQEQIEQAQKIAKLGRFEYDYANDQFSCSKELIHIFEFPQDQCLSSENFWKSVHPKDLEMVRFNFVNHLKSQEPFYIDHRIQTVSGKVKNIRVSIESEFNSEGRCTMTIGTGQDVTREYKRNDLLRQSQERLDMAIRAGDIGIFDWNLETSEIVCDDTVYGIYEEKLGSKIDYAEVFLNRLYPEKKQQTLQKLDDAIKQKEELKLLYDIILPSGKKKYIQLLADFQIKDDRVIRMVGMANDVTSKVEADRLVESFTKKLEDEVEVRTEQLKKTQEQLEAALKKEIELGMLKSRFVATASHQFRTPLSVIQSNVELISMLNGNGESKNPELLNKAESRIENEVKRMTDLTDDVLILGKLSSNQIPIDIKENDLVTQVKQAIQNSEVIQDDNRYVEFNVKGNPQLLKFDERTIDHVIENLLSNAFKYSRTKNPQVHLNFNNDSCTMEVVDFGIGIPPDEIDNLFNTFYRCSNVGDISGTGLGLAIVKDYVELNGGTITVCSEIVERTAFKMTLPY